MSSVRRIAIVSNHSLNQGGGRENSIVQLAQAFAAQGLEPTVVAKPNLGRQPLQLDSTIPIHQTEQVNGLTARMLREERVDVAIYNSSRLAEVALPSLRLRRRQVLFIREVEEANHWTSDSIPSGIGLIANSHFVADRVLERIGRRPTVVHPLVDVARYRAARERSGERRYVTMINPIRIKGLHLACEVAAKLPHVPFLFVEGWAVSPSQIASRDQLLAELPNVTLAPWRADPEFYYAQTRLLLAPSLWEEGFGRVVVEANAAGIPVIARQTGGIPEALGSGGVLMAADATADDWAAEVAQAWEQEQHWQGLQRAALANADRFEDYNTTVVDRIVKAAEETRAGPAGSVPAPWPAMPKVSVVLTHHNRSEFVHQAIASAVAQTYPHVECIVVDDFSDEEHWQALQRTVAALGSSRVTLLRTPDNQGQIAAFYHGVAHAAGDFVAPLDPDDVYEPEFLSRMVDLHLTADPPVGIVGCEMSLINKAGRTLASFLQRNQRDRRTKGGPRVARLSPKTTGWLWCTTSSLLLRSEWVRHAMPAALPETKVDLDCYLAQALHLLGGTIFAGEVLAHRRLHGENVSLSDRIFADAQERNRPDFKTDLASLLELGVETLLASPLSDRLDRDTLVAHIPPLRLWDIDSRFRTAPWAASV